MGARRGWAPAWFRPRAGRLYPRRGRRVVRPLFGVRHHRVGHGAARRPTCARPRGRLRPGAGRSRASSGPGELRSHAPGRSGVGPRAVAGTRDLARTVLRRARRRRGRALRGAMRPGGRDARGSRGSHERLPCSLGARGARTAFHLARLDRGPRRCPRTCRPPRRAVGGRAGGPRSSLCARVGGSRQRERASPDQTGGGPEQARFERRA